MYSVPYWSGTHTSMAFCTVRRLSTVGCQTPIFTVCTILDVVGVERPQLVLSVVRGYRWLVPFLLLAAIRSDTIQHGVVQNGGNDCCQHPLTIDELGKLSVVR